ncbi:MAG: hypothetical protein ACOX3E_12540 [Desulfomonilia bacterium]
MDVGAGSAGSGFTTRPNPVDLGVRVELPAVVMEDLTEKAYETKFIYYSKTFDDRVRTFCMNPYGEVVRESMGDILTVNGHSWARTRTENTNFAILVSADFTEPFDDPIGYGRIRGRARQHAGQGGHRAAAGRPPRREEDQPVPALARCLTQADPAATPPRAT